VKRPAREPEAVAAPLRRPAVLTALAVAAIAGVAWLAGRSPAEPAPAAVVKAPAPANGIQASSWSGAAAPVPPPEAASTEFVPSPLDEERDQRAAEARERWQNLDIAVSPNR
jgi:hypothetical protein